MVWLFANAVVLTRYKQELALFNVLCGFAVQWWFTRFHFGARGEESEMRSRAKSNEQCEVVVAISLLCSRSC